MIGLIFGETDFPKYILQKIKKKHKYLIIDLTKKKFFKKYKNSHSVSVGQFGKIISILKKNNCKQVIFAGKVIKPNFKNMRLDLKGIYYIPRIIKSSKLGDAAILKQVISILKNEKIKTLRSDKFTPELCLSKGNYTYLKPDKNDRKDIKIAINAINKAGKFSHVQGAISRNNKVISIETDSGTQSMIKKVKKMQQKQIGVLVKFPKPRQDLRIDLPTVGLATLKQCKLAGLKGIVLKRKSHIFLEKRQCVQFANKNKMFILIK